MSYTDSVKNQYNKQYEKWVPWLEDQYLYYFGKDNKASYATKRSSYKLTELASENYTDVSARGARQD